MRLTTAGSNRVGIGPSIATDGGNSETGGGSDLADLFGAVCIDPYTRYCFINRTVEKFDKIKLAHLKRQPPEGSIVGVYLDTNLDAMLFAVDGVVAHVVHGLPQQFHSPSAELYLSISLGAFQRAILLEELKYWVYQSYIKSYIDAMKK